MLTLNQQINAIFRFFKGKISKRWIKGNIAKYLAIYEVRENGMVIPFSKDSPTEKTKKFAEKVAKEVAKEVAEITISKVKEAIAKTKEQTEKAIAFDEQTEKAIAKPKKYIINHLLIEIDGTTKNYKSEPKTLAELSEEYSYVLLKGNSYSHKKGYKNINLCPPTIKSLINNLNNAVKNSSQNIYSRSYYSFEEIEKAIAQPPTSSVEEEENHTKYSGEPVKVGHLSKLKILFNNTSKEIFDLVLSGKKTQDRRLWMPTHGRKMQKCIGQIITATRKGVDYDIFVKNIYQQKLGDMTYADVCAEGFENFSPQDFINQIFDGHNSLKVWVIEFELLKDFEFMETIKNAKNSEKSISESPTFDTETKKKKSQTLGLFGSNPLQLTFLPY